MNGRTLAGAVHRVAIRNERIVRLALAKIGRLACRHAFTIVQRRDRLFLRCPSCGAESPGIVFDIPDPRERVS
jgi:hypothetical protein